MVWSVVKQDDCVVSPIATLEVEVLTELSDEQKKCYGIILTSVDCEEELSKIAHCCYDIKLPGSLRHGCLILDTFD